MGGGVSSLPAPLPADLDNLGVKALKSLCVARGVDVSKCIEKGDLVDALRASAEVSLAEAKELAGARWQPAWEEKFAEAKISRDEAIQCWQETEANAAISEALYEKLLGANRSRVAEVLDFSAIVNEKRGQHLPGTREWVFEAGQDTLLLSDSLVLSRNALSLGVPLVEQLWQRLVPRADAESSPAARRLADDAKQVASKLPFSAMRPMGLAAAGGAERCRIEAYARCLTTFVDPATGEPRLACACGTHTSGPKRNEVYIYDPVAGGAALFVIDTAAWKLAVLVDPATGELRLATGSDDGKVRIFDPVAGGEALLVIVVGVGEVKALVVFEDLATGAPRLACGSEDGKVRVFDPVTGGEALIVLEVGEEVKALAVFIDPATGAPQLVCASGKKVLVFDPVVGGDALLVLDISSEALAIFTEPATGAPRLACGYDDEKVLVFDAVSGGDALLELDACDEVSALIAFDDLMTGAPRLACGVYDGKVRVFDPVAGGEALVVLEGHTYIVNALTAFEDPATGEPRLASGSDDVRIWNPAAGGAAIEAEADGHSANVRAQVTFVDPATGALRVATGCGNWESGEIRVWDAETGNGLLVIYVGSTVNALAFFVDPATGAPRLACTAGKQLRVFDPVAGGEALLVIDVGSEVNVLVTFVDPATGEPRLACGCYKKVFVFDPRAEPRDADDSPLCEGDAVEARYQGRNYYPGKISRDCGEGKYDITYDDGDQETGVEARLIRKPRCDEALVVIDVGSDVYALEVFADPTTGELRIACGCGDKVHIYDPVAGGEALLVLDGGGRQLVVFTDPATGGLRLASGSVDRSARVWDLAAGGAALFVLEGHAGSVKALTAFADPATGEMRLVSGSEDKTLRVWDASKGGAALRVIPFDDEPYSLTVRSDASGLFVALGKRWGELRI